MNIAISALSDEKVIEKLKELSNVMGGDNVRTNWITRAKELFKEEDNWLRNEIEKVIDVCYNLAVESSISVVRSSIADIDEQKEYFLDMYNDTSNNYEDNNHKYLWSEQNTDELLNFDDNDIKSWESFIRIIEDEEVHNIIDYSSIQKEVKWKKVIEKYKKRLGSKFALRFFVNSLIVLFINIVSSIIINMLTTSDYFMTIEKEGIMKLLIKVLIEAAKAAVAAICIEGIVYLLKTQNMFDLMKNENRKNNKDTCNKIIKYLKEKNNNERNEK